MKQGTIPLWWDVFITEYLKNGQNGKLAYLKAHPKVTPRSAESSAERLLRNDDFLETLKKSQEKLETKMAMSRERWLSLLMDVAEFDVKDYLVDEDGDITLAPDWKQKDKGHAIEMVDVKLTTLESGQVVKRVMIKKENKTKALEMIGKALGYMTEKVEVTGTIDIAQKILEARKRINSSDD